MRNSRRVIDLCVLIGVIAVACYFWRGPGHPLHGVWEGVHDEQTIRLEFLPDGTLHVQADGELVTGSYRADLEPEPHHLDAWIEGEEIHTIFDFPDEDRMRIADAADKQPRPTGFGKRATLLLKRAR